MKTHYPAAELVDLPGMPKWETDTFESKIRSIQHLATKEKWDFVKLPGRGGPRGYALAALPLETQIHLQAATLPVVRKAASAPSPAIAAPAPVEMAALPDWQRNCADARLGILRLLKAAVDTGHSVKPSIVQIIAAAKSGELPQLTQLIPLANARPGKKGGRTLGARTLLTWWTEWKKSGFKTECLVPDSDRQPRPEPAWADAFMKEWRKPAKPALTDVLIKLKDNLPPYLTMPSYDQARYYLARLGLYERSKVRVTGNELLSLKTYRRRLTDHMLPGDGYTADGHTFDAEVAHPISGRAFRPEITIIIDIATRLIVGWSVSLKENALAVIDALRVACENFAVPVIFYTDNGPGYKNQILNTSGSGLLDRLGITAEYSKPRNPQAHGLIERTHRTVLVKAAKELATYIGASMDIDSKQAVFKETRKATKTGALNPLLIEWDDFVAHVNRAATAHNNRPHKGLGAYRDPATRKRINFSPYQAWQTGMKRAQSELLKEYWPEPAKAQPDLYHPCIERTVVKGYIQFGTLANGKPKMYHAPDLVNWNTERVLIAFNPSDASQVIVRSLADGRPIAIARLDGNSDPYFAKSYIEECREKSVKGKIKRHTDAIDMIELESRGAKAVIIEHPAALQAKRLTLPAQQPTIEIAAITPLRAGNVIKLPLPEVFSVPEDRRERWNLWNQLHDRIVDMEELSKPEMNFYASFRNSPTWKSFNMTHPKAVAK